MVNLCMNCASTILSLTMDRVSLILNNTTHNYILLLENNTLAELVGVTVLTAKETRQQNKKSGAYDKTKKGSKCSNIYKEGGSS